ncbi:MAG: hypothetical protein PUP46_08085 [Endozoicomonas sp. (ex Botrylloides leachii)]|nr:hypothetical protein [Endozoicomonas sp. (ex Botrylloides leachii)]
MPDGSNNIHGDRTSSASGNISPTDSKAKKSGRYSDKHVTPVEGERHDNGHEYGEKTGIETKLYQRNISVHESPIEHYQNCQFQLQVANQLLDSDEEFSDDLGIYYLDEQNVKISVVPRDENCTEEIFRAYLESLKELEDHRESILKNCTNQLVQAKSILGSNESVLQEINLTDTQVRAVQFSHLLSMASIEEARLDEPETDSNDTVSTRNNTLSDMDDFYAIGSLVNNGASPSDVSTNPVVTPSSDSAQDSEEPLIKDENADQSARDGIDQQSSEKIESGGGSGISGLQDKQSSGKIEPSGGNDSPRSPDKESERLDLDADSVRKNDTKTTLEVAIPDNSDAALFNNNEVSKPRDKELKGAIGDNTNNSEEGKKNDNDPAQVTPSILNKNNIAPNFLVGNLNKTSEKGHLTGENKEKTLPDDPVNQKTTEGSASRVQGEHKEKYTHKIYDNNFLVKIRQEINNIDTAEFQRNPEWRKFYEELIAAIEILNQQKAEMEDKCNKLEYQYKLTSKNYTRTPPDNSDEQEQAIKLRLPYIKKVEELARTFDEKAKNIDPFPESYEYIKQHFNNEIEVLKEINQYNEKSIALIKSKFNETSMEDIGLPVGDINDQIKKIPLQAKPDGRLVDIIEAIKEQRNKNGSMKAGINKGVNNIIKGIIDTSESHAHDTSERIIKGSRASRLVQATAACLLHNAQQDMSNIVASAPMEAENEIRKIRDQYQMALKQLYPKHWGTNSLGARGGQISYATYQHINQSVVQSIKQLDEVTRAFRVNKTEDKDLSAQDIAETITYAFSDKNQDDLASIRHKLAGQDNSLLSNEELQNITALINKDDDFCEGLVAAFSSLQETFAVDLSLGNTYQQRAEAAMRMLRVNHQLTDALSTPDVLAAIIQDVSQPDSKLMPHFINRYGGTDRTKNNELRSIKIIKQAINFLNQEETKHSDKVLKNRTVRECFREGAFYEKDTASLGNQAKLTAGKQLLNTFLNGCNQSSVIVVPQTQEQHINTGILIKGRPIIFSGEPLSAELLGSRWAIDPGFIIDDHPDIQVPFESKDGNSRDWIPIKDSQSGKTAILAMSKQAGRESTPLLYEIDTNNQWRCIPLASSGKPEEDDDEELQGTLFAMAACHCYEQEEPLQALASRAQHLSNKKYGDDNQGKKQAIKVAFERLKRGSNQWMRGCSANDIDLLIERIGTAAPSQQAYYLRDITGTVDVSHRMESTNIKMPIAFEIKAQKKHADADKAVGSGINDINAEKLSSDIGTFHLPPSYYVGTSCMIEGLREVYKEHGSMKEIIDQLENNINEYGNQASAPSLHAFQGCIVDVAIFGTAESLDSAKNALKTVIAKSRRHTALLFQEREQNRETIQELLDKTKGAINTNLFEHAVLLFERNQIPSGLSNDDQDRYIQSMANYLLLNNAYQVEYQQLDRKEDLLKGLEALDLCRIDKNRDEFVQAVKQWNLEMAIVAEQQWTIDNQLNSYQNTPLDSQTLARLAFECRAKTVLRSNQVDEVKEALDTITQAMKSDDTQGMQRVSQKGTGWGKSTVVKMLADHACAQLVDLDEATAETRSVLVIAPKSNQAELDIALGQYFRQGGKEYRRLDMSQYTGYEWWTNQVLDEIHNTLLGLPSDIALDERQKFIKTTDRAPVGASIEDIQVLLHLRKALSANASTLEDQKTVEKLNRICDLLRESMMFVDEWDSALMPPLPSMLDDMAETINKSLGGLPSQYQANADSINTAQSSFILGAKRKHLLSATTGSAYLLLQATGEVDPTKASEVSHLSLQESTIRALRWVAEAEILFCDEGEQFEPTIAEQIVKQVGADQGVIYLDAQNEKSSSQLAEKIRPALAKARGHNRTTTLFYNDHKHIQKLSVNANDEEQKKPLTKVEEKIARQNGAKGFDTVLSQRESIGTDCPQNSDTPLIHVGFLAQEGGRLDYTAQQLGRMRHDQPTKKQRKMMVVKAEELSRLTKHSNLRVSNRAKKAQACRSEQKREEHLLFDTLQKSFQNIEPFTKLLTAQLDFPVSGRDEEALNQALDTALDKMVEEWSNHFSLTPESQSAIKSFKRAQFNTERAIRELMFEMLAVRDRSTVTESFEHKLEQTSKLALAENLLAEEQHHLDVIGKSKTKQLYEKLKEEISVSITEKLKDKGDDYANEKAEYIAAKIANETESLLKQVVRPPLSFNPDEALNHLKSTSFTAQQVDDAIQNQCKEENSLRHSIEPSIATDYHNSLDSYKSELNNQLEKMNEAIDQLGNAITNKEISVDHHRITKGKGKDILSLRKRIMQYKSDINSNSIDDHLHLKRIKNLRKDMVSFFDKIFIDTTKNTNLSQKEFADKMAEILRLIIECGSYDHPHTTGESCIGKRGPYGIVIYSLSNKDKKPLPLIETEKNTIYPEKINCQLSMSTMKSLTNNGFSSDSRLKNSHDIYAKAKKEYDTIKGIDIAIQQKVISSITETGNEVKHEMSQVCTGKRAKEIELLLAEEKKRAQLKQAIAK